MKELRCNSCGSTTVWTLNEGAVGDYLSMFIQCPNCGKDIDKPYATSNIYEWKRISKDVREGSG